MKRLPLRLSFLAASTAVIATLVACGSISDPTKGAPERPATISGALTGASVPANARVALVWKVGHTGTYEVGSDVAVTNGGFTMDVSVPATPYFFSVDGTDYEGLSRSGSASAPSSGGGAPAAPPQTPDAGGSSSGGGGSSGTSSGGGGSSGTSSGGAPFGEANKIAPQGGAVSGQITPFLDVAVAGFVVYVDTNNNGKLDIAGSQAGSTDDVIGGNKELFLAYFRNGGALDYEKLRDRSGILPNAGYNLAWDQGRWLPLNVIELKLSAKTKLPQAICEGTGPDAVSPQADPSPKKPFAGGYPHPNDPHLNCSPDGYSFTLASNDCTTPPPPPPGLCNDYEESPTACAGWTGDTWNRNVPVPADWPCPIPLSVGFDAGSSSGSGGFDAGSSSGWIDAGSSGSSGWIDAGSSGSSGSSGWIDAGH